MTDVKYPAGVLADDPPDAAFGRFFDETFGFTGGGAAAATAGTSCNRSLATASQNKCHTGTYFTYLLLSAWTEAATRWFQRWLYPTDTDATWITCGIDKSGFLQTRCSSVSKHWQKLPAQRPTLEKQPLSSFSIHCWTLEGQEIILISATWRLYCSC